MGPYENKLKKAYESYRSSKNENHTIQNTWCKKWK